MQWVGTVWCLVVIVENWNWLECVGMDWPGSPRSGMDWNLHKWIGIGWKESICTERSGMTKTIAS